MSLQHAAALHEDTVQALARGEVDPVPPHRPRAAESRPRSSRVHVTQVHPLLLATVHHALEGSYTHVTYTSATEAWVE